MSEVFEHGAAKSGVKSEKKLKELIREWGFNLLKTKRDFIEYYGDREAAIKTWDQCQNIDIPEAWRHLRNARTKGDRKLKQYCPDGYIPELDCRVELKYSEKHGTTEEKVIYDQKKIERGCYKDKKLVYIFAGKIANEQFVFDVFAYEVSNIPNVKVIFDDTPDLSILKEYLIKEYQDFIQQESDAAVP